MRSTSKEIREEIAALIQKGRDVIERAEAEHRGLTAEDRETIDRIHEKAKAKREDMTRAEAQEQFEQGMSQFGSGPNPFGIDFAAARGEIVDDATYRAQYGRIDSAFNAWAKAAIGVPVPRDEADALKNLGYETAAPEMTFALASHDGASGAGLAALRTGLGRNVWNALTTGVDTGGGFIVRQGFVRALEVALLAASGMLQASTVLRTQTGEELPYPTCDDTSEEGELLPEKGYATEGDMDFGSLKLRSYTFSSKIVRVQQQLIRDASIDAGAVIGRLLGERLGRGLNRNCTAGTGAAQPSGIVPMATLGVTAATATAITADNVIELIYSVDGAYRTAGAGFMMADAIFKEVSLLKDGSGNYLLRAGLAEGPRETIRGWPVRVNAHMDATLTASKKIMLFGQLTKYIIRQVGRLRVQRFVERWGEYNQLGFLAFQDYDGGLLDAGTHPVKYLQMNSA